MCNDDDGDGNGVRERACVCHDIMKTYVYTVCRSERDEMKKYGKE